MKSSLEKRWVIGSLGLALVLMGLSSLASYQNVINLIKNSNELERTHKLLETLSDISATLLDAESGRRGYFLFNEPGELTRYHEAIQEIPSKLKTLEKVISDDPNQEQKLATLKILVDQRLALSKKSIELYQNGQVEALLQPSLVLERKHNREAIRFLITDLQNSEKQLLRLKINEFQVIFHYQTYLEFLGFLLGFIILLVISTMLYRQMIKRQQAEAVQQALARDKELGELKVRFFSMVSHEFRTPLSLILGSAQLLLENTQQWEEKSLRHICRIQETAKTTTRLLEDILTLTRAEVGKLNFNPRPLDVEAFCLNLLEDIQIANEPERSIQFFSEGVHGYVCLDEKLLYSILSNLLSNALKYSPPLKDIFLTLECAASTVTFEVRDEGFGIPVEEQQLLYEPFYRGKNMNRIAGSGLGLAVVRKCVDVHQGKIWLKSEVGVGTTFTVALPNK